MKLLLVSGIFHQIMASYINKIEVINEETLILMICLMLFQKYQTAGVLLTDDTFSSSIEDDKNNFFFIRIATQPVLRNNGFNEQLFKI